jgi:hypothetical protein
VLEQVSLFSQVRCTDNPVSAVLGTKSFSVAYAVKHYMQKGETLFTSIVIMKGEYCV